MRFCFIVNGLLILCLFATCESREETEFVPSFDFMKLKSVEVVRLVDQDSWDRNSRPDVFIRLSGPGIPISTISDTITDFDFETNGVIALDEIEIDRNTNSLRIQVMDFDFDPNLPDDFQEDDRISWFTIFPWSEFSRLSAQNTYDLLDSESRILLTVETR